MREIHKSAAVCAVSAMFFKIIFLHGEYANESYAIETEIMKGKFN
jgi:hypothetical protein